LLSIPLFGQDGHFWTQQYGTRSMLLSGSVIGGVDDLGAVYYNPARLSQITNSAFLVNADVYEWNTMKFEDAFGENKNESNSEFGGVPSLAAGTFKLKFLKKHHFAWAILLRQNMDINLTYKDEVYEDILDQFPGKEYFGAEIIEKSKTKEEWFSVAWAYPINDKLSIGASGYFSVMDNRKSNTINMQAMAESNEVAIYRFDKRYSMNFYTFRLKAALSHQTDHWIFGFTALTPPLNIKGDGNYQNEYFFSGIKGQSENPDIYVSSYQNNLDATYHSPWSVGLGVTYLTKKARIHFSTEWYSAVSKYTVMETADYIGQSTGENNTFTLVDANKKILNAGIGLELPLSEKVNFFTSFSTDFSTVADDAEHFIQNKPEAYNSVMKADFYHFGGGFVLNVKRADLTLGVTHTGAKFNIPRSFSFPEDDIDEAFDPDDVIKVKWNRWRIVFSFTLGFLKEYQKKIEG
ncbi:hypothetical protein N9164_17040, partial [Draconibacterium sp.]|nr:hypothetical protein [Draconibacterium sp.]